MNPASHRGDKLFKAREAISTSVKINFGIAIVGLIWIVVFRTQSPTTDLCGESEVLPTCECTKFYNFFSASFLIYVVILFVFFAVKVYELYHAHCNESRRMIKRNYRTTIPIVSVLYTAVYAFMSYAYFYYEDDCVGSTLH